jgi:hypothetical protein
LFTLKPELFIVPNYRNLSLCANEIAPLTLD